MSSTDKERCQAAHSGAAGGGTGGDGDACSAPLCKPLVAAGPSRGDIFLTGPWGGGGGRGKGRVCPIVYLFIWPVGLQWGIWELSRPLHLCGLSRYFSLPCRSRQRTAPALPLPRPGCPPGSLGSSVRVAWVTPGPFLQTANWERRNPPASSSRVGGKHAETPLLPPLCPPI